MFAALGSLRASARMPTFIIQADYDDANDSDYDSDYDDSDYDDSDDNESDNDVSDNDVDDDHDYGQFVLHVLCQHLLFKLHSGSPSVMVVTIIMIIVKICSFYLSFTYVYNRFSHN